MQMEVKRFFNILFYPSNDFCINLKSGCFFNEQCCIGRITIDFNATSHIEYLIHFAVIAATALLNQIENRQL